MSSNSCIIFGGAGFIGQHLLKYIFQSTDWRIYICDIKKVNENDTFNDLRIGYRNGRIQQIQLDVRDKIDSNKLPSSTNIIFNLAAIHITPGHESHEYFETNSNGAQNICDFASAVNCRKIVFLSSIAVYGLSEELKAEKTLPMPSSAYGVSKLVAEYIHKNWCAEDRNNRKLVILRPGVVFGRNEGGNFTRLYQSMKKGIFFYPGRKDTAKTAIYVKDLVRFMVETIIDLYKGVFVYNACFPNVPDIEVICETIAEATGLDKPKLIIPGWVLLMVSRAIHLVGKTFGFELLGVHPDRVKKLMISTNVTGEELERKGYKIKYDLREAIEDWFKDCDRKALF